MGRAASTEARHIHYGIDTSAFIGTRKQKVAFMSTMMLSRRWATHLMPLIDKLKTALADLSVKQLQCQKKRPSGGRGNKIEFMTNLTRLNLKPNVHFFKCDVRMYIVYERDGRKHFQKLTKQTKYDFPEQQRKTLTLIIYKQFIEQFSDVFTRDGILFYDCAHYFFLLK
ncbi:hypothetical protein KIN20_025335 [Parelaphostrongylus tenuis]|uniref:Uncharacterized protein n=1 Tax=Parelaphostrongylus tenuis TaxID=148309 RepID=A0AAD5QWW7_PARTN|nr:hypothetical protein KIN20_025335 [Parelaphostrongylus tenuis]